MAIKLCVQVKYTRFYPILLPHAFIVDQATLRQKLILRLVESSHQLRANHRQDGVII